jgi:hypothetical protein
MALVIAKPGLVLGLLQAPPRMDDATVERLIDEMGRRPQGSSRSVDR